MTFSVFLLQEKARCALISSHNTRYETDFECGTGFIHKQGQLTIMWGLL